MIHIHVEIDPELKGPVPAQAIPILNTVLTAEGVIDGDITVVFGDDELLNGLKKQFFHLDQFTDVIAFRINEYDQPDLEGELYISLPRAQENAAVFGEPYAREVARLIIHGGLHMLNYDDRTESNKKIMRQKEEVYLGQVKWKKLI